MTPIGKSRRMTLIDRLAHDNHLRKRHPAEKLLFSGGMLGLSLSLPPWPGAVVILAVVAVAALTVARLPVGETLRVIALPAGFLLVGLIVLPLSVTWGEGGLSFALSLDGLHAAATVSLRALAAASCLVFLALTTPVTDLVRLLGKVGVPAGVLDVMLLTYRFIFLFLDVAAKITAAQKARLGWNGTRRRVRSVGLLAAALLPRALEQARRMEIGLAARNFTGEMPLLSNAPAVSASAVLAIAGAVGGTALASFLLTGWMG